MKFISVIIVVIFGALITTYAMGGRVGREKSVPLKTSDQLKTIYDAKLEGLVSGTVDFADFKGNVVLVVNVASRCGYTYQYEGLQSLYEMYKDQGLVVVGVPSNDFMGQEPGTNDEIKQFCQSTYNVSFPMTTKLRVNGASIHPLYHYLTSKETNPKFSGKIAWNFNKFLIGKNGEILNRYGSGVKPLSSKIKSDIELELNRN